MASNENDPFPDTSCHLVREQLKDKGDEALSFVLYTNALVSKGLCLDTVIIYIRTNLMNPCIFHFPCLKIISYKMSVC